MVNTYNTIIVHEIDSDLPDWQQTFQTWQLNVVVKPGQTLPLLSLD